MLKSCAALVTGGCGLLALSQAQFDNAFKSEAGIFIAVAASYPLVAKAFPRARPGYQIAIAAALAFLVAAVVLTATVLFA